MHLSKYKSSLVIFALYIVFWIIIFIILRGLFEPPSRTNLTNLLPLDDIFLELGIIILIILPLSALSGLIIGGYLITPIILYLHKKTYGSKMHYGIQMHPRSEKLKPFSMSFFPVLMAINISSILFTPSIVNFIITTDLFIEFDMFASIPMLLRLFADIIMFMLTIGLATMLFSSVWFLRDSGIIYSNKKKVENSNELILLHSIGEWYQTILKSYAGIGALITYILVIFDFITRYIDNLGVPSNIFNFPFLVLWLGLPIHLSVTLIPTLIFSDLLRTKRISYIKKISAKIGIKNTVFISFEFKNKDDPEDNSFFN
ncbi:MAG: hypothetical protein ACFFEY_12700 [Candidatus Thorarchaeota archaeon]